MDDILIMSTDQKEHDIITMEVLKRLDENDLYLKTEKCEFDKDEIEFVGLRISHNKVAMDPAKVQGILEWPIPKTVKDV